jgi:hypothetical protein
MSEKNNRVFISSNHKDLFQRPTTSDKLTLLNILLDAKDLNVNLALALLKIIHKELCIHQSRDRSGYKRYADAIASLHYYTPTMLQEIITAWDTRGITAPMEWFSHEKPTDGPFG